jgi:hypothetical protein
VVEERGACGARLETLDRLPGMEAVFIALMALVVLMTGYVALAALYKLFASGS